MAQLMMNFDVVDVASMVSNLVENLHKGHKATVSKTTKVVTKIVDKILPKEKADTEKLQQIYNECVEDIKRYKNKSNKTPKDCLGVLKMVSDSITYRNTITSVFIYFEIRQGSPSIIYQKFRETPYSVEVDEDDLIYWIKEEIHDAKKLKKQRSFNLS